MSKPNGHFSRRHNTAEAHITAQQKREEKLQNFYALHKRNAHARSKRSPAEQLAMLDKRLGKGVGAKRERKRLNALIESVHANDS